MKINLGFLQSIALNIAFGVNPASQGKDLLRGSIGEPIEIKFGSAQELTKDLPALKTITAPGATAIKTLDQPIGSDNQQEVRILSFIVKQPRR